MSYRILCMCVSCVSFKIKHHKALTSCTFHVIRWGMWVGGCGTRDIAWMICDGAKDKRHSLYWICYSIQGQKSHKEINESHVNINKRYKKLTCGKWITWESHMKLEWCENYVWRQMIRVRITCENKRITWESNVKNESRAKINESHENQSCKYNVKINKSPQNHMQKWVNHKESYAKMS